MKPLNHLGCFFKAFQTFIVSMNETMGSNHFEKKLNLSLVAAFHFLKLFHLWTPESLPIKKTHYGNIPALQLLLFSIEPSPALKLLNWWTFSIIDWTCQSCLELKYINISVSLCHWMIYYSRFVLHNIVYTVAVNPCHSVNALYTLFDGPFSINLNNAFHAALVCQNLSWSKPRSRPHPARWS